MTTLLPRANGFIPDAKRVPSAFAETDSEWDRHNAQSQQDQELYATEWEFHEETRPARPGAVGLLEFAK